MTNDELKGKVARLQRAAANPEVKYWLECVKELGEIRLIQDYHAKGEEAVRAMGIQMGIGMALKIEDIYSVQLSQSTQAQIIKPR